MVARGLAKIPQAQVSVPRYPASSPRAPARVLADHDSALRGLLTVPRDRATGPYRELLSLPPAASSHSLAHSRFTVASTPTHLLVSTTGPSNR